MWSNKWPVLVAAVLAAAIVVALLYKPAPTAVKPTAQNTTQQNTIQYVNWDFNYLGPPPVHGVIQIPKIPCTKTLTLVYTYRLPKNYTVVGPLGEVARSAPRRLAWHVASLTVSFGNDSTSASMNVWMLYFPYRNETPIWPPGLCNVTIEARTQVVELLVNGTWVEVPPALIRGNYTRELNATGTAVSELLQWHLFETPEQVAQYFDSLIRDIGAALIELGHYLHSPPLIYNNTLTSANETYIPDACMSWPVLGSYPKSSNYYWSPPILSQWPPAKTWALSAFAKVNSTDEICGWAYPVNGSNLAVPYNHYAAVPLSVWQGGYDYGLRPVAVLAQGAAQIWPPALIYNVWFVDQYWLTPFGPGSVVLWGGYTPLASPADWLGLGAEFCISISQTSPNSYIYIDGHMGGTNYKMATVAESLSNSSEMTVTPGAGFTQSVYVGLGTSTQKPVWGVIAIDMASNVLVYVPLSGVNDTMGSVGAAALGYNLPVVLYPSMAFETDDTSSSFFNYNTNFAVGFEMGPNPSNPGSWPLYYSISNNTAYCASQGYNIWGSSGVGTSWPPANTVWGASGATLQPNYYLVAVGSISQMQNSGLLNVYPISCQYVDGQLSSLNTHP